MPPTVSAVPEYISEASPVRMPSSKLLEPDKPKAPPKPNKPFPPIPKALLPKALVLSNLVFFGGLPLLAISQVLLT